MSDINNPGGNEVPENQPPAAPPPPPPAAPDNAGATPPPPPPAAPGAGAVEDGEYTLGKAFTYGWNKFRENAGPIIIALILYLVVGIVLLLILNLLSNAITPPVSAQVTVDPSTGQITSIDAGRTFGSILMSAITSIIMAIYGYIVAAGIVRGVLKVIRGEKLQLDDLLPKEKVGTVIIASVIVGILTGIGYMLCIVPGILVAVFSTFFLFFIYDKNKGAWEAITSSWKFVMDNFVQVLALVVVGFIAMVIGALLCGVGLVVAFPVVYLAYGYAFKKLHGEPVAPIAGV